MKVLTRDAFSKYTDKDTFERIKYYDTVSEMWKLCVEQYSSHAAIVDEGKEYSFAQLENDAAKLRAVFEKEGFEKGAKIVLHSTNSYEFVKAYIAIVTSGMTAIITPPQLPSEAVQGISMMMGANAVVYEPVVEEKLAGLSVKKIVTTAECGESKSAVSCDGSTPCVVMFTGGTTGKSKAVLLCNKAVMEGTVNGCYGVRDVFDQRYLLVLPLSHVFGLIRNLMTSLYTGSVMAICKSPKDLFREVAVFKPTILVLVPALVEMSLGLSRQFGKNMLGESVKTIICGAAAVSQYLIEEYSKLGVAVFPGYGLTESANLVSGNPEYLNKPGSVGIMYPNQEYELVDGELWLKGSNMLTAYLGPDQAFNEDGWFRTGDLARVDEDGFLYITGRIKELIVLSNGENVSPAEVEAYFNEPVFVQDSQVFEDVDEKGHHFLALEVVLRASEMAKFGDKDKAVEELKKINSSLPGHMQVSSIVIRDKDFERTPSMKIVRYKKC